MGLTTSLFFCATAQAGEASASMLSDTCSGCHGPNGVTNGPAIPTIAGMTEEYLVLSMQDYRDDKRKGTVMNRIAKGYTDTEITAMARYFSEQEYASLTQSPDASMVARGDELQQRYCNSCHEKSGVKADGIGVLAGQAMPYLSWTIADFMTGDRPMERRKQQKMDQLAADAGDEGFHAVVQYYSSHK